MPDHNQFFESLEREAELRDWPAPSPRPVVFLWQPDKYCIVPESQIAEWESVLVERFGIAGLTPADGAVQNRSISFAGGYPSDSDMEF